MQPLTGTEKPGVKIISFNNPNLIFILSIAVLVMIAHFLGEISIIRGTVLILFGSLTAISFYKLVQLITEERDSLGIESSFPSLDGSVTGWKFSRSLTMLIITVAFAIPTVLVILPGAKNRAEASIKNHPKIDSSKSAMSDSIIKK